MTDYKFKDVEFLTAKEKQLILKAWIKFLDNGLKQEHFTKRLYEHCRLHCGFIAHYNINGFYAEYFNGDYKDLQRFFSHFENDGHIYTSDYTDINKAMAIEFQNRQGKIFSKAEDASNDKFELLKECVKRAETDLEFRKDFLHRIWG